MATNRRGSGILGVRRGAVTACGALLCAWLSGCSSGEAGDVNADATEAIAASSSELSLPLPAADYFALTRDVRRCASPRCGGYWVQSLNRLATRCSDGTLSSRCYVAEASFPAGGEPSIEQNGIVVRGQIESRVYEDFGELGRFVARAAWTPASSNAGRGAFFLVGDNGIRCITEPCFSSDAELLNLGLRLSVSDLDLTRVGADDAELAAAAAALAKRDLIVAGSLALRSGTAGLGLVLTASQFFLPGASRCYSDDDCSNGSRCNAGEICLPPPGCRPGASCPAVCTGYCIQNTGTPCASNADCGESAWCRSSETGSAECVPFVGEGARCEGFTLPSQLELCAPGLTCDPPELVADAPGVCRTSCKSNSDCADEAYCATDELCHPDASCDVALDCVSEGNNYPHPLCVGFPTCPQGQIDARCGWRCGNTACIDFGGHDFGACDAILGWGRVNGTCAAIGGCSAAPFELFTSEAACQSGCPG
jgi:uncharacterized protein DUF6748